MKSKKYTYLNVLTVLLLLLITGCEFEDLGVEREESRRVPHPVPSVAGNVNPNVSNDNLKVVDRADQIYFIFTNHFADGDASNNGTQPGYDETKTDETKWFGGDFGGLENRINYISDLGFTTVWITPPFEQIVPESLWQATGGTGIFSGVNEHGGTAYHGYHANDYRFTDRHLGSKTELTNMISSFHASNIDVMVDVTPNHTANKTEYDNNAGIVDDYKYPNYTWDDFHHNGNIQNFNDPVQSETYDLFGLEDLAQQDITAVEERIKTDIGNMINDIDADAIRCDAVRHIGLGFWNNFCNWFRGNNPRGADFFSVGEAFTGSVGRGYGVDWGTLSYYVGVGGDGTETNGGITSMLDFALYFGIKSAFAQSGDAGNPQALADVFAQDGAYATGTDGIKGKFKLLTFIDNHDVDRFLTTASNDLNRWKAALTFIFTCRGIPVVYYGTENPNVNTGTTTNDENRKQMVFDQTTTEYNFLKQLTTLRGGANATGWAIRYGVQQEFWNGGTNDAIYAFGRIDPTNTDNKIHAIFNTSWNTDYTISGQWTYLSPGTYTDKLGSGGEITVTTVSSTVNTDGGTYTIYKIADFTVSGGMAHWVFGP